MEPDGSCAVRDYRVGRLGLQDAFYPFTQEPHLFNCEYYGPDIPLSSGSVMPSSVKVLVLGYLEGYPF
jgi:hypothetical protein